MENVTCNGPMLLMWNRISGNLKGRWKPTKEHLRNKNLPDFNLGEHQFSPKLT